MNRIYISTDKFSIGFIFKLRYNLTVSLFNNFGFGILFRPNSKEETGYLLLTLLFVDICFYKSDYDIDEYLDE